MNEESNSRFRKKTRLEIWRKNLCRYKFDTARETLERRGWFDKLMRRKPKR